MPFVVLLWIALLEVLAPAGPSHLAQGADARALLVWAPAWACAPTGSAAPLPGTACLAERAREDTLRTSSGTHGHDDLPPPLAATSFGLTPPLRAARTPPAPVEPLWATRLSSRLIVVRVPGPGGWRFDGASPKLSGTRPAWAFTADVHWRTPVLGAATTTADRTSRVVAARGRLRPYLPTAPPRG